MNKAQRILSAVVNRKIAQGEPVIVEVPAPHVQKHLVVEALRVFINSRPGLEWGNYGTAKSYREESRRITRQRDDARILLSAVSSRDGITAADIIAASRSAYSGRLSIGADGDLNYCTGQYYPTEYRAAVCAVLSSALWSYWREPGSTGDSIRDTARREFGRTLANRWFR